MKKIRKPIQIAALRCEKPDAVAGQPGSIETEVWALCDDGSIWTIVGTDGEWVPLPPVPQDQLREDWLAEVGEALVSTHLLRREALSWIMEDYRDDLRGAFNNRQPAQEAAKEVNAKVQSKS